MAQFNDLPLKVIRNIVAKLIEVEEIKPIEIPDRPSPVPDLQTYITSIMEWIASSDTFVKEHPMELTDRPAAYRLAYTNRHMLGIVLDMLSEEEYSLDFEPRNSYFKRLAQQDESLCRQVLVADKAAMKLLTYLSTGCAVLQDMPDESANSRDWSEKASEGSDSPQEG